MPSHSVGPTLCHPTAARLHGGSPGKNTGGGCHALLQGIFPTQGPNPGLPKCRWMLYCLSHRGSPRTLEWEVYPFSKGSSWHRNQTGVSCIPGGFFTSWVTREAPSKITDGVLSIKMTSAFALYGRRRGRDDLREQHRNMYITKCETDRQSRLDAWDKCSGLVHWDNPEGWGGDGGGRGVQDGKHM